MRTSARCLKCGHSGIWHIDPVCQPDDDSGNIANRMVVATMTIDCKAKGIFDASWERVAAGRFEAYVCEACGYTEWYAKDLDALHRLVGAKKSELSGEHASAVQLEDRSRGGYR